MTIEQRFKNAGWIALIVLAFLVVYLASWTPVYVEGDDAASIVYHATGEHVPTLGPYSPYQSGMDVVLNFLPQNEAVLRPTALAITSVAAVLTPILMYLMAFDWLGAEAVRRRWLTAILVLLATPEFFYLGLVYLPSIVAICGVLAAHLVLRRTLYRHWHSANTSLWRSPGIYMAVVLFALGASCRWDIATYGAVIFADILIGMPRGTEQWTVPLRQRAITGVMWGVLALVGLLVAIRISGYTPSDIVAEASSFLPGTSSQTQLVGNTAGSIFESVGGLVSYFTPVAVVLAIVGLIALIVRRSSILLPIAVGVILVLPWVRGGTPKFLLPSIPGITVCLVLGFEVLWYGIKQALVQNIVRAALIVGLIAIWGIGIQVDSSSAWGPGFQLRDYDRSSTISGIKLGIGLRPGLALPLSEGPRPLFGHAYVLLGGQWRSLVTDLAAEQEKAIAVAVEKNLPEVRMDRQNPGIAVYVKLGYAVASDPVEDDLMARWTLTSPNGTATMWALNDREALYSKAKIESILQATNQENVVVFGFPSDLRKLYQLSPASLQKLGTTSALLNLKTLAQSLQ